MSIVNNGKYYLYRHIRLDKNEPFYIGIGTKTTRKYATHITEYYRAFKKCDRNDGWKRITNKTAYEIEILLESNDYEFIKKKEIEFIQLYGRRGMDTGSLINYTEGGDGVANLCKETRDKMSFIQKNNPRCREVSAINIRKAQEAKKKKCFIFNLDGVLLYICKSRVEAQSITGVSEDNISIACKLHFPRKNLIFSDTPEFIIKIGKFKRVKQFDVLGNFIKIWNRAKEAEKALGLKSIPSSCLRGFKNGGYYWKYEDLNTVE